MVLSSSSRSPMITAELSMRHGTSGILIRAGPDHSCVTICRYARLHLLWLKALERHFVLLSSTPAEDAHVTIRYAHIWLPIQRLAWGRMQYTIYPIRLGLITWTQDSFPCGTHSRKIRFSAYRTSCYQPNHSQVVKNIAQKSKEPSSADAVYVSQWLYLLDRYYNTCGSEHVLFWIIFNTSYHYKNKS